MPLCLLLYVQGVRVNHRPDENRTFRQYNRLTNGYLWCFVNEWRRPSLEYQSRSPQASQRLPSWQP